MIQGLFLKWPNIGDRSSIACPAVSESIEILDSHNHDGNNSEKIHSRSIAKTTITLSSANWENTGSDFKQGVTLPSGFDFETATITAVINSGSHSGKIFHPTINKTSVTTFDLHCMLGNVEVKVVIS